MKPHNRIHLNSFRSNDEFYTHVIDTSTDDTHCINSENVIVFTVSSDAYLTDGNGNHLGKFSLSRNNPYSTQYDWEFVDCNGVKTENPLNQKDDLIAFEVEIFKKFSNYN